MQQQVWLYHASYENSQIDFPIRSNDYHHKLEFFPERISNRGEIQACSWPLFCVTLFQNFGVYSVLYVYEEYLTMILNKDLNR